jgi:hypothetical protein
LELLIGSLGVAYWGARKGNHETPKPATLIG